MSPDGPGPRARRYRAVSLDLWSTSLRERPGADGRLREARLSFLQDALSNAGEGPIPREQLEGALVAVHAELRAEGRHPIEADPAALVGRYAASLGTRPRRPIEEIGVRYSGLGLDDDPPPVNPEAESLVAVLLNWGVPIIAITDTGRREASWQAFFRSRSHLPFRHIVTSCEVGRAKPDPAIFNEAARRLGLRPGEIVHIGDRWDRDVRGALGAGFGAVLYSGLPRPDADDRDAVPDPTDVARLGVTWVRRLDDPSLLSLIDHPEPPRRGPPR